MASAHDLSDNELDAFDSRNEQILLEQAGGYLRADSLDEDSEEEVLGLKHQNEADSESGSESEAGSGNGENSEDEDDADGGERWGSKKNYYGGDDVSDDDGGAEMAEEALRQQKKHLQELAMDDFVDEDMMQDWQKTTAQLEEAGAAAAEAAAVDFDALDAAERLAYLNGLHPEFVPLLTEYNSLAPQLARLPQSAPGALGRAKHVALSAYLGSIAAYFALFVDQLRTQQKFSMKEYPVMEAILSTREVWRQARELSSTPAASSGLAEPASESEADHNEALAMESNSDESLAADGENGRLQTDSETDLEASEAESDAETGVDIDVTAKRAIRKPTAVAAGDYTEATAIDVIDKEEKARRKKSLRFYTSKIDQAAKKNAANERFDGDLDLPYRERFFERQQRLVEEARKKGLGRDKAQLGEDLDGADYGSGDEALALQINEDAGDYYESIRLAKLALKDARRLAHEQAKQAARLGKLGELAEHADEQGKRALNFQIMKNKGLTPNRRNDNRNARVKKRKRYDQAQKKLKSVRQVYDESTRGPYQGEKTGIKKGLSRSVRLQ